MGFRHCARIVLDSKFLIRQAIKYTFWQLLYIYELNRRSSMEGVNTNMFDFDLEVAEIDKFSMPGENNFILRN